MLTRTIDGLRRMTRDLRPAILDDLGLHHAIESLVAEFTDRTGIHVTVTANDSRRRLDPKTELVLFRIAQEALRNVEKHSGAGHVSLDLHVEKDGATLRVADDGRGFEPGKLSIERDDATGLGLPGMQERAKSIDGTLRVKSHPGQGTLIEVRVASRGPQNDPPRRYKYRCQGLFEIPIRASARVPMNGPRLGPRVGHAVVRTEERER
jgi:two-component system NarL family sensor kinase